MPSCRLRLLLIGGRASSFRTLVEPGNEEFQLLSLLLSIFSSILQSCIDNSVISDVGIVR